jgi:hypothetical protein
MFSVLSIIFKGKKDKYLKRIENLENKPICKTEKNLFPFLKEKELNENNYLKEKYDMYIKLYEKILPIEKKVFTVLLAMTVISLDIPILIWAAILCFSIILALDSIS